MSNSVLRRERRHAFASRSGQVLGVSMLVGWALLIVVSALRPVAPGRLECRTDPWDFLRIGELLEPSSLAFLVEAHCANAKYVPDGWIELSYGGGRLDVELRPVAVADSTYFRIVSIGGIPSP